MRSAEAAPAAPLPVAAALFALSGAGALVLETLWQRWLRELLGGTAPAVAATLLAFFAGQALGAAAGARWRSRHPLRRYGALELAAALAALAVPLLLAAARAALDAHYDAWVGAPALLVAARLAVALAATLPASFCFGATWPALVAACVPTPAGLGARAGALYAANTLGALVGLLAATFALPQWLGVAGAYQCGVAALALAGGLALLLASRAPAQAPADAPAAPGARRHGDAALLALAALSGACAFAAQVLFVQAFARVLNQSGFAFAVVLGTVLLCLALGAAALSALSRSGRFDPRTLVAASFAAAALATLAWPAAFVWASDGLRFLATQDPWPGYLWHAARLALGVLGPACLAAACVYPALLALAGARAGGESGARAGRLLAANTAGAACGALLAPWLLLPALGVWGGLAAVAAGYAAGALLAPAARPRARLVRLAGLAAGGAALVALAGPAGLPQLRVEPGGRLLEELSTPAGLVAAVARDGGKLLQVDNHYALGGTADAVRQARQGHLPLLLHPAPQRVAFLGSATGGSASAALAHPVDELVLVELVPGVAELARRHFAAENGGVYDAPQSRVVLDDARSFLRASGERFDVIVADLFVPWQAGTGALYTREHFEAARAHLRPGGLFCQWLPLYQLDGPELETVIAGFLDVFPDATLWRGDFHGEHPIAALIGGPVDLAGSAARAEQAAARGVTDRWVAEPLGPAALAVGPLAGLRPALAATPRNTDDRPVIEWLAARGHAGGPLAAPVTGRRWLALSRAVVETAPKAAAAFFPNPAAERASRGGYALQAAGVLYDEGHPQDAARALAAAAALLPRDLLADAPPDPTAADVWPDAPAPAP